MGCCFSKQYRQYPVFESPLERAIFEGDYATRKVLFFSHYCNRQNWSLPDPIICYIIRNPVNIENYQKMIKCCKYLFHTYPIIIIHELKHRTPFYKLNKVYWETFNNNECSGLYQDLTLLKAKFWITESFKIQRFRGYGRITATEAIPRIFQSNIKILELEGQIICFKDLKFLSLNVETLRFEDVTVKDITDTVLPIEKLFEIIPKIKTFKTTWCLVDSNICCSTVKNIIKLPNFISLNFFGLAGIPENFDIAEFLKHIKSNKQTRIYLKFDGNLSDAFTHHLEEIIDTIIYADRHDYKIPYISHEWFNEQKSEYLLRMFNEI